MIFDILNEALDKLLISFFNKELTEEEVLKELNCVTHYNKYFRMYMLELFFVRAIKMNKVPRCVILIMPLFNTCTDEDFIMPDLRSELLKLLKLEKSYEMYDDWNSRIMLGEGVEDDEIEKIKDMIIEELKD